MNFARNPFSPGKRVPIGICFVIILSKIFKKIKEKITSAEIPHRGY
jgi:hypothetical protein